MRHLILFIFFFFSLNLTWSAEVPHSDHRPGEVIVVLNVDVDVKTIVASVERELGGSHLGTELLSDMMRIYRLQFENSIDDTALLSFVQRQRGVALAQFNHTNLVVRSIPNDSLFGEQWPFLNDGTNGGSGLVDINAIAAWDIARGGVTQTGDTIVVAIIDQGFDLDHIDLVDNFFINREEVAGNGVDDDNNGYVDDVQGWDFYNNDPIQPVNNHGTHVAGTVGAVGNNTIGVTGVNWNVKMLPITGSSTLESTVVSSYAYVYEMRKRYNQTGGTSGAYIVATNSSFGVDEGQPEDYPIWCAMYDSLGYEGVLSAGATINDDINVDEEGDVPTACSSPFLISVTNTRSTDALNSSAGFGEESIDLGAPGSSVYSTIVNDNYGNNSGTSMATPHVAGTIGLMYNALCSDVLTDASLTHADLALFMRDKMLSEGVDQISSLDGLVSSGGRLNMYKSVYSVSSLCVSVAFNANEPDCDSCNGALNVTIVGAEAPYELFWSNGATSDTLLNLCPGIYSVTVVEEGGDSTVARYALSDVQGPNIISNVIDVSCPNESDGEITVSGGYNYQWFDAGSETHRTGLKAGSYFLVATDSIGLCTTSVEILVRVPDSLKFLFGFEHPTDSFSSDGTIHADITGGSAPYSYVWQTGDTTHTVTGLPYGNYALTVTDAMGCEATGVGRIGYPLSSPTTNNNLEEFILWPNPSSGQVFIRSGKVLSSFSIYDVLGREVYRAMDINAEYVTVDMSIWDDGVYLFIFESNGNIESSKVVLRHGQ